MSAKILAFRPAKAALSQKTPAKTARRNKQEAQKFRQEVDHLVQCLVDEDIREFAFSLVTARAIVKLYPELVAAPKVPEHLAEAYKLEWDDDANNPNINWGGPFPSPKRLPKHRALARRLVTERLERLRQSGGAA